MQEDGAAAAVAETSTEEDAALKKTNIAKNKGGRGGGAKKNKKPLSEYSVGSTVEGKIINIMPYGAFVDIGATTDGLVHVSHVWAVAVFRGHPVPGRLGVLSCLDCPDVDTCGPNRSRTSSCRTSSL